jgi:hypothetical protein
MERKNLKEENWIDNYGVWGLGTYKEWKNPSFQCNLSFVKCLLSEVFNVVRI